MAARFVPIVIQIQEGQATAQVAQLVNAFKQLDKESENAGSHGVRSMSNEMRNAVISGNLFTDILRTGLSLLKTWIVDSTLFAGRTQELTIALHQMAKANGIEQQSIDKQLEGLIGLNIARQEATQILTQMIGANLDLSKATQLARVAQDTAVISGKNSSEAFRDLTSAILLGNTEAFRAAGIFISVEDALKRGAKALKVNQDALTEQQRTQILTNTVIEYGARVTGTYEAAMGSASKQMRSMQRLMDDAKDSVGELFQGAFAAAIVIGSEFLKQIKDEHGGLQGLKVQIDSLAATLIANKDMWKDWGGVVFEQIGHVVEGIELVVHALEGLKYLLEEIKKLQDSINNTSWAKGLEDSPLWQALNPLQTLLNRPSPFDQPVSSVTRVEAINPHYDPFGRSSSALPGFGPRREVGDDVFNRIAPELKTLTTALDNNTAKNRIADTPLTAAQRSKAERAARDREIISAMKEKIDDLAADFMQQFGKALPYHFGQTGLHTKLNYDHRAAADISLDARTEQGQFVLDWLSEHGINARASLGKEISKTTGKLISTGVHIHAGELSGAMGRGLTMREGLLSDQGLQKALAEQALVFAPWSGQMVTQSDYDTQKAALNKQAGAKAPLETPDVDPEALRLPIAVQRQWDLYYEDADRREKALNARREDFAAEYSVAYKNMVTEVGNLDLDLRHLQKQNADDQFVEQRRLLMAKGEEVDLTKRLSQVQDQIATGPYNQALRLELATQEAILDVQRQREAAMVRNIQNQIQLSHQMDVDVNRLNDGVVDFLAQQRTLQETFQDVRTNSVRAFFDGIDSAIDRMTKHLGLAGQVLGTFLKDLAHLAASQVLQRLLGLGSPASASASTASTDGGILNFLGSAFRPNSTGTNSSPFSFTAGNITGPQAAQTAALASAFGSGGITAPASLSSSPGSLAQLFAGGAANGVGSGGSAAASAATGGGLFGSSGLAAMLPLLGAGVGAGLGGSSTAGSILGIAGGGLLGLAVMGALPASMGGLGFGLAALMGPAAIIGGAALIGALILAKNAQRRKDEKTRNTISNDTGTAIWQLIQDARSLGTSASLSRWNEIANNYQTQIAQIKDGKTKRNAQLQWTNDFLPLLAIVKQRAKEGDAAKAFSSAFIPTFAGGSDLSGLVPYRGGMQTWIKVRPGERIDDVGMMKSWHVPGIDYGRDSVYTMATPGSAVRTRQQQARIPGFAGGSNANLNGNGGSSASPLVVQIPIYFDAGGIVAKGAKSSDGRKAIAGAMHEDAKINGRDGYAGTLEIVLTQST